MWQYVDETFEFENGRLVLYGANGSGKTMALELLYPYLLDANASPSRLTTAGGNERGGLWSRVSGYTEQSGRVGYLWIEFARVGADGEAEHFTCGTRLETKSKGGIHTWFTTSRRVGFDLRLLDRLQVPLTADGLRTAVEGAGKVHGDDQAAYRTMVRTTLYAGFRDDQYKTLIDGLLEVRKQSITDGLTDAKLNTLLTAGLPALDPAEVDQVARGFEQLDARRETIAELEAAVRAARVLEGRVRTHARSALRAAADAVSSAESQHTKVTRDRNAAETRLAEAVRETAERDQAVAAAIAEDAELTGRSNGIRASAQYQSIDELDARRTTAESARRQANQAAESANALSTSAGAADDDHRAAVEEAAQADSDAIESLRELGVAGRALNVDVATSDDLAVTAQAWRDEVAARQVAVDEVRERRIATDRAIVHREDADAALERANATLVARQGQLIDAISARDTAGTRWAEAVAGWAGELVELALEATVVGTVTADVDLAGFQTAVVDAHGVAQLTHGLAAAELDRRDNELRTRRGDLDDERRLLEATDHVIAPPLAPWRDPRDPARPGAPLWALVELADERVDLAGLEAALDAAGILDAFLPSGDDSAVPVGDTSAASAPAATGPSLADVLVVDGPAADAAGVDRAAVAGFLAAVAVDMSGDGSGRLAVGADGSFRYGPLAGAARRGQARHIGAVARERARAARLAEVVAEIAVVDDDLAGVAADRAALEGRVGLASSERQAAPDGHQVAAARRAVDNAEDRVDDAEAAVAVADATLAEAAEVVRAALLDLNRAASEHGLPTVTADLNRIDAGLRHLDQRANNLEHLEHLARAARRAANRAETFAVARRAEADAARVIAQETDLTAGEHEALYNQLEASVGTDARAAAEELAAVTSRQAKLGVELTALRKELVALEKAQGKAEAELEGFAGQAEAARVARDDAGTEFRAVVDAGIAGDASIDVDEDLSTITSVLRAARAVNRVVTAEPNSERLMTEWAQVEEQRFTSQAALAGRAEIGTAPIGGGVAVSRATATIDGVVLSVANLVQRFGGELERARAEIADHETALFEQTLTGSLRAHLASRLRAARSLVDGMNDLLSRIRTASGGVAVSLRWEVADDVEDQATLTTVKELLLRDHHSDEQRDVLFGFLRRRIDLVRNDDRTSLTWSAALSSLFDYRYWHRFRLMVRHDRFGERPVAFSSRKVSLSAGEKSLVLSLPLFAAVASHYMPRDEGAESPGCPRLLLLDEVFPKNDRPNKRQILGLLSQLDLDCVLTSDKDMCDYDTVDGIAIAVIAKDGDESYSTRLVWNGHEIVPAAPVTGPAPERPDSR